MRCLALALFLTGCQAIPVSVSAASSEGGVRVQFVRGVRATDESKAQVETGGGRLEEIVFSADRQVVSVLWLEAKGSLYCRFPYGGEASWHARTEPDSRRFEYVFLDARGAEITAVGYQGAPVVPGLVLYVRLAASELPARLHMPEGVRELRVAAARVPLRFAVDKHGALFARDYRLRLETASGASFPFLIGVDYDGTPSAVSGYLRNWKVALD